ncbi:MAG: DUF4159 domain-containing protein [Candidatus Handelsmanbacteria bacterium]|nr:DUF4159 domain-containing protein [Candidatus Handelsmanbacteria bacterium]
MSSERIETLIVINRRNIALALGMSLVVHLVVLGSYSSFEDEVEEAIQRVALDRAPPPGFFVKPPTATAKNLEFRKVPVPQGYYRQKKETTQKRVDQMQALAALRTDAVLERLQLEEVMPSAMRREGSLAVRGGAAALGGMGGLGMPEPSLRAEAVQGVKEARQQVDMQLDMLSVKDMDTGQYRAMVVQDPNNRRKIKGFLHVAQGYSVHRSNEFHYASLAYDIKFNPLDVLIKALKEYTGIEADYMGALPLDDPNLLEVPWLLLSNLLSRDIGQAELANLGRYLAGGGFAIATLPSDSGSNEVVKRQTGIFDILRRAMKSQNLNEGGDWRFVVLEPSHPIYHSFFDFDAAVRANQMSQHSSYNPLPKDLGLQVGDRLAVFLNGGPDMETAAGSLGEQSTHQVKADATRALQFALNTVVFALTQEGSVTQQLMAGVR